MPRKKKDETPEANANLREVEPLIEKESEESEESESSGLYGRELAYSKFVRDEGGLLKNVSYVFKEDGTVNWKAMIPDEYIAVNTEFFERKETQPPTSTEGLDDQQKIVLLGGIKELAKIRGILSVEKRVWESSYERAVVSCKVTFIGNYETGGKPLVYEDVASATLVNTNSFSQHFLETIASNRAFVRAVRNALRIDIVGSDELTNISTPENMDSASEVEVWHSLREAAKNAKTKKFPDGFKTFDEFKQALVERKQEKAEEWNDWKDVPTMVAFKLIGQLKSSTAKAGDSE